MPGSHRLATHRFDILFDCRVRRERYSFVELNGACGLLLSSRQHTQFSDKHAPSRHVHACMHFAFLAAHVAHVVVACVVGELLSLATSSFLV
jgi:hypothetical protein